MEIKNKIKKASVSGKKKISLPSVVTGIIIVGIACILVITNTVQEPMIIEKEIEEKIITFKWALGRGAPADETTFVEFFLLDYASTPGDALQNNVSFDGMGNVSGYIDADNENLTVGSEEYFYPVVVIAYNRTHLYDEDQWVFGRANCRLTFAVDDPAWMVGDESIDDVEGTRVEMSNVSTEKHCYVAFYWDDGVNGYAFKDNALGVDWNLTICAEF